MAAIHYRDKKIATLPLCNLSGQCPITNRKAKVTCKRCLSRLNKPKRR